MDSVKTNQDVSITLNVLMTFVSQVQTRKHTLVKILSNLVPTTRPSLTRTSNSSPKLNKLNGWDNVLLKPVVFHVLSMLNVTTTKDVLKILASTNSVSTNQSTINGAIQNLKDKKSLSKHLTDLLIKIKKEVIL